jgi:uncharacterized protein
MQETAQTRIEAEACRRVLQHLDEREDVQNIHLANPAGFQRKCLAKWRIAAAENHGADIDPDQAPEIIYGIPHTGWNRLYQKNATAEQLRAFVGPRPDAGKPDA